jgi:histidyl-tRNA synthetase
LVTQEASAMRSRGMRDLLPDEMDRVRKVEDAFASACRLWGYREIRTPVIEPLHLFTAAGTLSPKMLDTVYSFLDWDGWSGERVVLRPDSTIPAARLYAESYGDGIRKLFYRQNIFRFTDDGSSREEWQCGVELIGDTGPAGDLELVLLALDTLAPLGLPRLTVRVSHAGLVRAALAAAGMTAEEQSLAYDRLLDGDLAVIDDIEARLPQLDAPLRLLLEVEGAGSGYIENLRGSLTPAIPALAPAIDELAFVVAALEASDVTTVIQAALARSFEYYSGIVFKIYADSERVCSGGRYDDLIGLVGDRPARASGFAHYLSPIVAVMHDGAKGAGTPHVAVELDERDPKAAATAHAAAASLRRAGIVAVTSGATPDAGVRLECAVASPRYRLRTGATVQDFNELEAVIAALESSR